MRYRIAAQLLILIIVFLTGQQQAGAALVAQSDTNFGADSVTLDTETGLQWLDLPLSINWPRNDIALEFGQSGAFAGWRFATQAEVLEFMQHAGFTSFNQTAALPIAQAAQNLIGVTNVVPNAGGDFFLSIALFDDGGPPFLAQAGPRALPATGFADLFIQNNFGQLEAAYPDKGHWLTRAVVPEPTTGMAALLCLLGATWLRIRR